MPDFSDYVRTLAETVTVESVADPHTSRTDPRPAGWISLPDTVGAPMPLYLRNSDTPYWFEHLPAEAIVYFQFNGIGDQPLEPIAAFGERLFTFIDSHQVSKLVIDLRWNGGGNTYLAQPLLHRLIGCAKVNQRGCLYAPPSFEAYSQNRDPAMDAILSCREHLPGW